MDSQPIVSSIEKRAAGARVSIAYVCQRAGVHPTTFFRWRKSEKNLEPTVPNWATLQKVLSALDQIEAEAAEKWGKRHSGKAVAA